MKYSIKTFSNKRDIMAFRRGDVVETNTPHKQDEMVRKECPFQAEDGISIAAYKWFNPSSQHIRGIVQIAHGMAEHILRYEAFAHFLVNKGFIVYGHDHRGHGRTAAREEDIGYFSDQDGFEQVVRDMKTFTDKIALAHPNIPIILFGHSMGSFITRRYIQLYGTDINGAIISGTGGDPGILGKFGKTIARRECKKKGRRTKSPLLDKLSFGSFNKQFKPNRTPFDWLSRDEKQVDLYIKDESCGNIFTAGFFADLFDGLHLIHLPQEVAKIPKDLPVLFIAGDQDPVGKNGKAVLKVVEQYKQAGMQHVSVILYEQARHELLQENNREEVYRDIEEWLSNMM